MSPSVLFRNVAIVTLGLMLFACGSSEEDSNTGYDVLTDTAFPVDGSFESTEEQDTGLRDAQAGTDASTTDAIQIDPGPDDPGSDDSGPDDPGPDDPGPDDPGPDDPGPDDPGPDDPGPEPLPEVTVGTLTETKLFDVRATSGDYSVLQGGASDGTHGYFVMMWKKSGNIHVTQLVKYQISDGKRVSTANFNAPGGVTNLLGHGNDAAFNRDTGKLIIPAWTNDKSEPPEGNDKLLRVIDPTTLNIVDTKSVDVKVTNLCYAKNTYLTFSKGEFHTYDANFQPIKAISFDIKAVEDKYAPTGKRVGQGIDCDGSYVYITRWYPDDKSNIVYVANWNAQLVGVYDYKGPESEHLMHASGYRILHGFNTPGGGEVRRINKLMFMVQYEAGGGSGSMKRTRVLYGRKTRLRKNTFALAGKQFAGWAAERRSEGKWRYQKSDGSEDGWYTKGKQPSGWSYYIYKDEAVVLKTAPWGLVKMHATWK